MIIFLNIMYMIIITYAAGARPVACGGILRWPADLKFQTPNRPSNLNLHITSNTCGVAFKMNACFFLLPKQSL